MPQVDFYILPDSAPAQRALFACRLIEKIQRLGHRIYVHHRDGQQAQLFDELLWGFQPASFIPHDICERYSAAAWQNTAAGAVQLGWAHDEAQPASSDATSSDDGTATACVLINLAEAVPSMFAEFSRVVEIVVQTPDVLAATRNAWRHYQQCGCALERHDLRASSR